METAREVLVALARRYAFGDVAELATAGPLPPAATPAVAALCAFGQRLLDLDAEDFGMPEAAGEVPPALLRRARASRMPQTPRERPRGALETLRPAYALLLEVIEVRWRRREMAALVAAVHIAGEYLPVLAWEPVLGHAADPARLATAVGGPGSRFGVPLSPAGRVPAITPGPSSRRPSAHCASPASRRRAGGRTWTGSTVTSQTPSAAARPTAGRRAR